MFYVYILKSNGGTYYVGSAKNVERRFAEHNSGRVKSTKRLIPWQVFHIEAFINLKDARRREVQIKSWKSREAIERLLKKHF